MLFRLCKQLLLSWNGEHIYFGTSFFRVNSNNMREPSLVALCGTLL